MDSKTLPQPICFVTKKPYEDGEYGKWVAITKAINGMAKSDDDLALNLDHDERIIYFGNRLSTQCSVDGVTNFFDYGIAPYYHPVIDALRALDAQEMIAVLEGIRGVVMGDYEITEESIHEHAYEKYPPPPYEDDVSPWEVDLEQIASRQAEEDFNNRLRRFAARYFDTNGYTFQSDPNSTA